MREHQRLFGSGYNRCRRYCGTQLDDSDADMDDDDPGESAEDLLLALPVVSEDFGLKLIRCSGTEQVESSSVKCTSMFHFLSEGTQQDTTVASKMPKPGQLTWTSWSGFRRFSLLTRDMLSGSWFERRRRNGM